MKKKLTYKYLFILFFLIVLTIGCSETQNRNPQYHYIPQENTFLVIRTPGYDTLTAIVENHKLLKNIFKKEKISFSEFKPLKISIPDAYLCLTAKKNSKSYDSTVIADFSGVSFTDTTSIFYTKIHSIQNREIIESSFKTKKLYSSVIDGYFLSSTSREVIDGIVNRKALQNNSTIEKFYAHNKRDAIHIFVKNRINNPFINYFFNSTPVYLENFDWIVWDAFFDKDHISVSGIAIPFEKNEVKGLFNVKPKRNELLNIVPNDADELVSHTFSNSDFLIEYVQNRYKTLSGAGKILLENTDEIGLITVDKTKIAAIHTSNYEMFEEYLGIDNSDSLEIHTMDNNIDLKLFTTLTKGLITPKYVEFMGGFAVLSKDRSSLDKIHRHYINDLTYSKSELIAQIQKHRLESSNILMVRSLKRRGELDKIAILKVVNHDSEVYVDEILQDIRALAVNSKLKIQKIWSIDLDDKPITTPQFVLNHRNNKKEIIVRDGHNNLCLIDHRGKILWKKHIQGRVIGKIHQVDLFKNGFLQLAFCTDRGFFIVDRNANFVKPFEKNTYKSPITHPLSVFDYDRNKNYRFVITSKNKLYMYNSKGKAISDFRYKKRGESFVNPPKHIRIGNKDFICIQKKNGQLQILNRRGNPRIDMKQKFEFSANPVFYYKKGFATSDKNGQLVSISTSGHVKKQRLNIENKNHDLKIHNGKIITLSGGFLRIGSQKIKLESGIYTKPQIFETRYGDYISVTNTYNHKVYIYNLGDPGKGFTVDGDSAIDIGDIDRDGLDEICVISKNHQLILYQINR